MLQRVVRSTVIDAPIERVWQVLRDFNSHDQWHDVVASSRIEGGEAASQVGCVRAFTLKDGNFIREQLLTLDDRQYRSTYCIVEATVPLTRYVASVTLKPVTDGNRTFWHWESSFATPPGRERELRQMVAEGVYEAGFENLRRYLRGGADLGRSGHAPAGAATAAGAPHGALGAMLPARAVMLRRHGGPEVLRVEDTQCPPPGPGEVRVRQRVVGVNFIDIYLRRGWLASMLSVSESKPGTLGMEAAGSVIDVGEGVTDLLPGDRVGYLCPHPGAYASVRTLPAQWVVRLPPAVEDETAAAVLLKGLTVDCLLRDLGRVGRGTRLLVHAAAGGVGQLLTSWAAALGAKVIGTVSSEAKAHIARERGCEAVIVSADYHFAEAVQRHCGGADVIVDGLGDAAHDENLAALARCGHWISLGQASGALRAIDPNALLARSATFSRPVVFDYIATRQALLDRARRLWAAMADGTLPAPQVERFGLAAAGDAHHRLESRQSSGSLILLP